MSKRDWIVRVGAVLGLSFSGALAVQGEYAYEEFRLLPPPTEQAGQFSSAVDLFGDELAAGAPTSHIGQRGEVYLFERDGAGWAHRATFFAGGYQDWFGGDVSLGADRILIGAHNEQHGGLWAGAAYFFRREGPGWVLEQRLQAPVPENDANFGAGVALDGERAAVSSYSEGALEQGAVYVFRLEGGVWILEQRLQPPDLGANEYFGSGVELDGDTLVAKSNAPLEGEVGRVHVFRFDGARWREAARLLPPVPVPYDLYGVSLAPQGDTLVVGGAEVVDVYQGGGASWTLVQTIHHPYGAPDDDFGRSVELSGDDLIIGAPGRDTTELLRNTGAVHVYERVAGQFVHRHELRPGIGWINSGFGRPIAIDGETIVSGGTAVDVSSGAVYTYSNPPVEVGSAYCFGDDTGTRCPCDNPGDPGRGCANSATAGGALLEGVGTRSLAAHYFVLVASGLVPHQPALYFAGHDLIAGGSGVVFGDGLRCAGTQVVRIEAASPGSDGYGNTHVDVLERIGVSPGETRYFQAWYRDPAAGPCGTGHNLTNGYRVSFLP